MPYGRGAKSLRRQRPTGSWGAADRGAHVSPRQPPEAHPERAASTARSSGAIRRRRTRKGSKPRSAIEGRCRRQRATTAASAPGGAGGQRPCDPQERQDQEELAHGVVSLGNKTPDVVATEGRGGGSRRRSLSPLDRASGSASAGRAAAARARAGHGAESHRREEESHEDLAHGKPSVRSAVRRAKPLGPSARPVELESGD